MNAIFAIYITLAAIGVTSLVTFKEMTDDTMYTCQLTHSYNTCYTALNR